MAMMTLRDLRGLRAHVRRFAHEHGCDELQALTQLRVCLDNLDTSALPAPSATWLTEAYVALTHEIVALIRERRALCVADSEGPILTRTVAGISLAQVAKALDSIDASPEAYGLPPVVRWRSRVSPLADAWHGSLHVKRYRVDYWGEPSLVEKVHAVFERVLFP